MKKICGVRYSVLGCPIGGGVVMFDEKKIYGGNDRVVVEGDITAETDINFEATINITKYTIDQLLLSPGTYQISYDKEKNQGSVLSTQLPITFEFIKTEGKAI